MLHTGGYRESMQRGCKYPHGSATLRPAWMASLWFACRSPSMFTVRNICQMLHQVNCVSGCEMLHVYALSLFQCVLHLGYDLSECSIFVSDTVLLLRPLSLIVKSVKTGSILLLRLFYLKDKATNKSQVKSSQVKSRIFLFQKENVGATRKQ